MKTKVNGIRLGTRTDAGSLSLPCQRETIIRKAQESVRASHQRAAVACARKRCVR